jgi:integrase
VGVVEQRLQRREDVSARERSDARSELSKPCAQQRNTDRAHRLLAERWHDVHGDARIVVVNRRRREALIALALCDPPRRDLAACRTLRALQVTSAELGGDIPLVDFRLEHAETAMRALPRNLSTTSRRAIGGSMARVLSLAAWPLRLIPASPLPKGFLPRLGLEKAKTWIFPDDDAQLLGCTLVPFEARVLYGFLDREGMRTSEALGLQWLDLDLERGAVRLDQNKTDDPRAWALDPGVVRALVRLKALRPQAASSASVFVNALGRRFSHANLAKDFRAHLALAGVTRPELFEDSAARRPIRAHDLRSSFVTVKLGTGKTEAWISDRTGHRSSAMIARYRRAAGHFAELNLGDLAPLDEAIPELRERPQDGEPRGGATKGAALTIQH